MLGIIIGVASVIAMLAVGTGAQNSIMSRMSAMGTNVLIVRSGQANQRGVATGATQQTLTLANAEAIRENVSGISSVSPVVQDMAQLKRLNKNSRTTVTGCAITYFKIRNFEIEKGRGFTDSECQANSRVAVLGPTTVENLFGTANPIGSLIKVKGLNFRVIGVTKSKGDQGWFSPDDVAFIPYTTAMKQVMGVDYLREIDIEVAEVKGETGNGTKSAQKIVDAATSLLRKRHRLMPTEENDFNIRNQAEVIETASQFSSIIKLMLGAIASISLLVGGIGIMNIMLVTVTERTREIGIRKAIGARRRDIMMQFLNESMVLGGIGGAGGILFGVAIVYALRIFGGFSAVVDLQSVLLSSGFSIGIGVFSGFIPPGAPPCSIHRMFALRMITRNPMQRFVFAALAAFILALSIFAGGCSSAARWNISDVQPPASLDEAMRKADEARAKGTALDNPATPTLAISRDGAILTMLARNRSLLVSRLNPDIQRTYIDIERAAFDPKLLAAITAGRSHSPALNTAGASAGVAKTDTLSGSVQAVESLPTGTAITLSGGSARTNTSPGDTNYESNWSAKVSQSLLRGAGTAVNLAALRQAENSAEISAQAFRDSVLDQVEKVETAYWELVLSRESLRIKKSAVELAEEQLRSVKTRMELGSAIRADMLSAEAELASRRVDIVDAEAALRQRALDLLRLLSPETADQWRAVLNPVDPPEIAEIANDPAISAELARLYRPDLAQARLSLANADLETIRTRNGLLPKLDAFASYGLHGYGGALNSSFNDLDSRRYSEYSTGLEFEMSPLNRAEKALDRKAKFLQQQAEASIENLDELIAYQVRQDVISANQQFARIAATRQVIQSRQEQHRAMRARYEVGSATILDVLQVQSDLINAEVDEITARIRYIQALTALYRDEGTLLDRRGVSVPAEKAKTEKDKSEKDKAEKDKVEKDKVEKAKAETPSVAAPQTEAPKTEAPKTETPQTQTPQTQTPQTQTPQIQTP